MIINRSISLHYSFNILINIIYNLQDILRKKTIIYGLTCITMYLSPSRFTQETRSTLYVTRVVFTVGGTRRVTVTAVDTAIITTWIN